MATYGIKIGINESWVLKFNKSDTKLCIAHGVLDYTSDANLSFNVVGNARDVWENIFLKWTDEYQIAGGKQSFSANTKIEAMTNPKKIAFGQSVTLSEECLLHPAKPDPTLGKGMFAFVNMVTASVYLYKQVVGENGVNISAPFYISQNGPNPPGRSHLTPKPVTRLFFAKHYESGTMVDDYQSEFIDVDLTNRTSASVYYDENGHWTQSDNDERDQSTV